MNSTFLKFTFLSMDIRPNKGNALIDDRIENKRDLFTNLNAFYGNNVIVPQF